MVYGVQAILISAGEDELILNGVVDLEDGHKVTYPKHPQPYKLDPTPEQKERIFNALTQLNDDVEEHTFVI